MSAVLTTRKPRRSYWELALTYWKALEIAQGLEVAAESLEAIKQGESSKPRHDQVNKVPNPSKVSNAQGGRSNISGDCHRCGKPGHPAARCRYKDMKCHQCDKVGHLKAVCRSKQKRKGPKGHPPRVLSQPVCHLEEEDEEEHIPLYHFSSKKGSPSEHRCK